MAYYYNGNFIHNASIQFGRDNRMTLYCTNVMLSANAGPEKVANVQPSIIKEFGEVPKLSWLGTAFALGSASTILPWYVHHVSK